jgi:hypothetical protein
MTNYRARSCPNCNYYVAFAVSKPLAKPQEAAVISFCLNCSYKIPVHSVIRGIRRVASPVRRGLLRLVNITMPEGAPHGDEISQPEPRAKSNEPSDYARDLRAIGQDLEQLRLTGFNLECTGGTYLVWPRSHFADAQARTSILASRGLRKLWQNRNEPRSQAREEYATLDVLRGVRRYRYTKAEIENIDRAGQARRRSGRMADGHSVSQLLRTIGGLMRQRNQKLLGIAWQELSVSVVFESERGRHEIDVFRVDHLYDLWVRMYLRRNNRVLSDLPR